MSPWHPLLNGWTTELRAGNRTRATVNLRQAHLRHFARTHSDPHGVTREQVIAWLANPAWEPETRKSHRASHVSFWTWAVETGRLDQNPAERLPAVHVPEPDPRPADDTVILAAMHAADPRTLLMIRLMAESGTRRAETAAADTRHLCARGLGVHGKGGKPRTVPLTADLRRILASLPPGPVFPSPLNPTGHLTPGCVGKLVSAVLPPGTVPHQLRHAAATAWHDAGLDIADIRPLLGHAKVSTTQRYVAVQPEKAAAAVEAAARRFAA